jgi:hypothetical protein
MMMTSRDNLPWFAALSPLYFCIFLALRPLSAVGMSFSDLTFPHLAIFGGIQVLYTYTVRIALPLQENSKKSAISKKKTLRTSFKEEDSLDTFIRKKID